MSKISLPQKNIQINGGKRFVFTMSAIIAAISSAVAYGASLVTFPNVVAAITLASVAYEVGKEITKETTPDELEKGWVIELVSKELNHLAAILHVYAWGLIFMK